MQSVDILLSVPDQDAVLSKYAVLDLQEIECVMLATYQTFIFTFTVTAAKGSNNAESKNRQ